MSTNQFNSVEDELWRIFTFYALYSDPTQPQVWKAPTFVRFAKECQIISAKSKQLSTSAIELDIAKLVNNDDSRSICRSSILFYLVVNNVESIKTRS